MKLFGNNIEIKCEYCANSADAPSGYICTLRKSIKMVNAENLNTILPLEYQKY